MENTNINYISAVTAKGNSSYSWISQEEANNNARLLDENNCNNCINCLYCTKCNDCTNCIYCIKCNDCNNCNYCNNCDYCNDCNDCKYCTECKYCKQQPSFQLKLSLYWNIYLNEDVLVIGCQKHKVSHWKRFNDETIANMDEKALEFWKEYKNIILSMCAKFTPVRTSVSQ